MVYKQKNPLVPTFIALAVVVGGTCVFAASTTITPSSFAAVVTGTPATGDMNLAVTNASGTPIIGAPNPQESSLLANIQEIQNINLDASVLNDSSFTSFTDFIRASSVPAGRANPFAPFAGLVASSTSIAGQ